MARTKPYEIIEQRNWHNHSISEMTAMLKHYGFIPYPTGGGHIHFKHREYELGHFGYSHGEYKAGAAFVEKACYKCMEVKRLNAERKKPKAEEIPAGITDELFTGFDVDHDHGVIRLRPHDISFESPDRTYEIAADHGLLTIKSLSFPEYAASVPLKQAAQRPEDFMSTFDALDKESVIPHIQEREQKFHAALADLESSAGCKINKRENEIPPLWELRFPWGTPDPLIILAPKAGEVIANETIAQVDALGENALIQYGKCEALLSALAGQGWAPKPNGDSNYLKFHPITNGGGAAHSQEFQVPVYGDLKLFSEDVLEARLNRALGKQGEGVTPAHQITEPAHDRAKAVNYR